MRIHIIEHVPFEGPGAIAEWAEEMSHEISRTRVFSGEPLPRDPEFDGFVVMGGPMGANDDEKFPWMAVEKRLIADAIAQGRRVLGVCLGAQLIADVLGARVYRNHEREIGWFPIQLTDAGRSSALFAGSPEEFDVLHWHGDTFDLPGGAAHLASSEGCRHQAFAYGRNVLGLQFHLELGHRELETLVANCPDDFRPGRYVARPDEILANNAGIEGSKARLFGLLSQFFTPERAGEHSASNRP